MFFIILPIGLLIRAIRSCCGADDDELRAEAAARRRAQAQAQARARAGRGGPQYQRLSNTPGAVNAQGFRVNANRPPPRVQKDSPHPPPYNEAVMPQVAAVNQ